MKNTSPKADPRKRYFSKKEAIDFGFEVAKSNLIYFISVLVIAIVVVGFFGSLQFLAGRNAMLIFLVVILRTIISLVISMGFIKISLLFVDKKKTEISNLFYIKPIVNYFLVSIIRGFIVLVGFIFLIIPGIILSIKFGFAEYLVVDKNMSVVDSLNNSWEITKGVKWNLFLFGILLFLINMVGFIALLVGLFITVPLTMVANAYVYRKLYSQTTLK